MKRIQIILTLLFLITLTQVTVGQFSAGLHGGAIASKLQFKDMTGEKFLFGYSVGLVSKYELIENFRAELGFTYTKLGGDIGFDIDLNGKNEEWKFSYFQIPLYGVYTTGMPDVFEIDVVLGGYAGLMVGSSPKYLNENTTSLDMGLSAGIGYSPMPELSIQATYNLGLLQPISENGGLATIGGSGFTNHNRFFKFGVTYYFYKL